MTCISI
jgi:casein kinase 1 gamma